ncbi:Ig-like domain-containing protein [Azospirillum sp. B510]|uniref:Ig-like domain-containing protein n=1 Tax=Azospirillum sp. (strain B510) TaxID=137722 RepID=UPI00068E3015|nr:Ig-like domain-containing protein [Azospirillum sp. B510]
MFDAAGAATATDHADQQAAAHAVDGKTDGADGQEHAMALADAAKALQAAAPKAPDYQVLAAADPAANGGRKEVAFIDTGVADWRTLANGIRPGVEVVLLDGSKDGLAQMAEWAQGKTGYDAVHVLSHGSEGEVRLGSLTLDSAAVSTRAGDLAALGGALTADGDLLLYGCEVASDGGDRFMNAVAEATGADVAASDDLTGAAQLGGNWVLERTHGSIETGVVATPALQNDYSHVLAGPGPFIFDFDPNTAGTVITPSGKELTYYLQNADATLRVTTTTQDAALSPNNTNFAEALEIGQGDNDQAQDLSETKARFDFTQEETFNINSIDFASFQTTAVGQNDNVVITTSKGSASITIPAGASSFSTLNLATQQDPTLFQNISWFELTTTDGHFAVAVDNINISNIILPTGPRLDLNGAAAGADNAISFTEDGAGVAIAPAATLTHRDPTGTLTTVVVTLDNPVAGEQLSLTGTSGSTYGAVTFTGSGSASITLTRNGASETELQDALRAIKYENTSQAPVSRSISVVASEDVGGTTKSATKTVAVTATAVNDAPTIASGQTVTLPSITEDNTAMTGVSVATILGTSGLNHSDPDGGSVASGIAVTAKTGSSGGSAGWKYSTDSGSNWYDFGDLSSSALLLDSTALVRFVPNQQTGEIATLTFRAWDETSGTASSGATRGTATIAGTGGTTAYSSNTATVSLAVSDVNDAPVNTVPGAQSTNEDTSLVFSSGNSNLISIADVDAGSNSVQVTLGVLHGTLTLSGTTGLSFTTGTGTANASMVFTGTISAINTALAGLSYAPTANYHGSDTLTITTNDRGNTGADPGTTGDGSSEQDQDTVAITVNPVADTPSVTGATTVPGTQTSSGLVISRNAADGTEVPYFKITNIVNGTLYQNDGTTQITTGSFITFAQANAGLKFTPSGSNNGSFNVQASTSNADGGLGGSTATATIIVSNAPTVRSIVRTGTQTTNATSVDFTVTFSESVSGVDATDFALATTSTATGTIGTPSTSDGGTTWTVSVTGVGGDGTLGLNLVDDDSIISSGSMTELGGFGTGNGNYTGQTYTIDNTAPAAPSAADMTAGTDSGPSNSDNVTSNTRPTFNGTAEAGTTVTLYDTDGATVLGTAVTNGMGRWSITPGSALSAGSHTLTVKAADTAGNQSSASNGLTVTIDATAPTVTIGNGTAHPYTENGAAAAIAGDATVTETGSPGSSVLSVQITANNEATDRLSLPTGTATGINVSGTDLRSGTTVIGTVTTDNVTNGAAWTITFASTATADDIRDVIRAIRYDSTSENPGTANRTVSFTLTDGAGNTATAATRTVAVTAVNDAPTDIALTASSVSKFDSSNATVGTLSATDVDDSSWTFTIVSITDPSSATTSGPGIFTIFGTTLKAATPSTLAVGSYTVRVQADDGHGSNSTYQKDLTITVSNDLTVTVANIDSSAPTGTYATDLSDGNGLDLREALYYANNAINNHSASAVTIKFDTGLSGTITLGGTYAVASGVTLAVNSGGGGQAITIASQSLSLDGALGISVATGDTLAINSSLADDGVVTSSLTKTGAGTLTLGGTNVSYSNGGIPSGTSLNDVTVSAGTLSVTNDRNLGGGMVTLSGGGTLTFTSGSGTVDILNAFTLGSGGGTIDYGVTGAGNGINLAGQISGSGKLTKTGAGVLGLTVGYVTSGGTTNSTWSGDLEVAAGTLSLTNQSWNYGNSQAGTITFDDGTKLLINGDYGSMTIGNAITMNGAVTIDMDGTSNTLTLSGALTGASTPSLAISNGGTVVLSGSNSFDGSVTVGGANSTSKLVLSSATAISDTTSVTLNANGELQNTVDKTIGTLTSSVATSKVWIDKTKTLTVSQSGNSTFAGAIKDGSGASGTGSLTKAGSGTLTLSGTNTYGGATTVSEGTLTASGGSAIADSSAVTVNTGATFRVASGDETVGSIAGAGQIAFGSRILTVGGNGNSTTFSGTIIAGNNAILTKTGTGTLTLTGNSSTAGFKTTVSAGTLSIGSGGGLASGTLTLAGSSTLDFATAATVSNDVTLSGNATIALHANNVTLSGNITGGTNTLTKTGSGTLTLSSGTSNGSAWNLSVGNGTVSVDDAARLGTGSVTLAADTTLEVTGATTLVNATTMTGSATISNSAAVSLSGAISGNGYTLTKAGAGTLTLSSTANGGSTFATTVSAGGLSIGAATNIGTGAITLASSTTLYLTGAATYTNAVALTGNATVAATANATLSGNITGSYALSVAANSSTATLSGNNSFSSLYVTSGTLSAASGGTAGSTNLGSGQVSLNGGSLTLTGSGVTVSNAIAVNSDATITNANAVTLSGVVSGSATLTKAGTGILTLSGNNSHSGATTVSAGTLRASGGSAIGDGSAVTVAYGAFLTLSASETIGSLAGAGTVTLGAYTLTTGGNNTNTIFSGGIDGTGGLTKTGSGMLTLSGSNSYSGATTISAGTVALQGGSSIGDTSAVTVSAGATLLFDDSVSETIGSLAGDGTVTLNNGTLTMGENDASTLFSGVIREDQAGNILKMGSGTLTLSGSNTYTGTTTVRGGTLSVAGDANLGGGTVTLNGGTLTVTAAGTIDNVFDIGNFGATIDTAVAVTLSGGIGGNSGGNDGLTKIGTGTLTLSGTGTYSGSTTVSAGTLLVTGALTGTSGMSVASGATLGGTGSIFASNSSNTLTVASGATLAPGVAGTNNGVGTLTVNGSLAMSGTLAVEIAGTAAGGYDQVIVSGGVTLSSGSSAVTVTRVNGFTAVNAATYRVIDQTGAGTVSSTLSGLAQGATLSSNGDLYTVDYAGGTGNDLVLTALVNPTVSSVSASSADGTYKAGSTVTVTVTFSRAVTVSGTPTLALNTGRDASYSGGSGTNTLTFTYIVQDGDNATDLDYASINALTLNGGGIADSSTSLDAILTLAAPGGAGSMGANKAIVIDTAAPTVSSVSAVNGTYRAGEAIDVTVTFSEAVSVTGTPTLAITLDDGTVVQAAYLSGSGGSALTFRYIVGSNLTDADGIGIGASISDGGIADLIGNSAIRTLNNVASTAAVRVDSLPPTVTNVTASTANGLYTTGDTITIQVTFSEAVSVSGTPTLALNAGRGASYSGGSGTNTLTFTYTVQAGDTAADLDAAGTAALAGSITDIAGNAGILRLATPGDAGTLGANKDIVIDTTAPSIRTIVVPNDGLYGTGRTLSFFIQMSEAVIVNGAPTITLDIGGQTRQAVYNASASTGSILRFDYVVQAGDSDTDGIAVTGLNLNGGSITDRVRIALPATLSGMPGLQNVLVDTVAPDTPSVPVLAPGQDTGASATDGLTSLNRPTLGGTAEPGSTVTVLVDGVAVGTAIAGTDGSWSLTPATPLADGTHAVTSQATDRAGNSSGTSTALSLTIDTTPPLLSTPVISSPVIAGVDNTANVIPSPRPTLTGTADPNSTVTVIIDGVAAGTVTAGGDGRWSFAVTTPLADGRHSVATTATDPAGNIGRSGTLSLTVDTQAPLLSTPVIAGVDNAANVISSPRPTLTGTSEPNSTVTVIIDGVAAGTVTAGGDGRWSFAVTTPLADGSHSVATTATDPAGNIGRSGTLSLTVDTRAPLSSTPVIAGVDNAANVISSPRPTLTGTAEPNSTVTVIIDGVAAGIVTAGGDGRWSFAVTTPLADGSHSVATTATDPAGNIGRSGTLSLTVDTRAPLLSTSGATATLSAGGTATLGTAVSLSDASPLNRVTVTLTDARDGDELVIGSLPAGITATRAGAGIVLTGVASAADYQAAVRAIGLRSSANDPSFAGTATSRSISIQARDLVGNGSTTATVTVAVARATTTTPTTTTSPINTTNSPATTSTVTGSGNGPSLSGGSSTASSSNGPSSGSPSSGLGNSGSMPTLPSGGNSAASSSGGLPGNSSSTDVGRSVTLSSVGGGSSSTDAGRSVTLSSVGGGSSSTDAGRSVTLNSVGGGSSSSGSVSSGGAGTGLGGGIGGGFSGGLGSGLGGGISGGLGAGLGSGLGSGLGGAPGTGTGVGAGTGGAPRSNAGGQTGTPDSTSTNGQVQNQNRGTGFGTGQNTGQVRPPAAGQPGSQGQPQQQTQPQTQEQPQTQPQGQPQGQRETQAPPQDGGSTPPGGEGHAGAERGTDDRAVIMPASPGFARQVARAHGDAAGAAGLLAALASHVLPDSWAA